ncbi:MAG: hypothetical protein KC978_25185, partial [Candidatus Omnitrophica bacterium]|nr:hypothetical protein [Candidatus Omnitrophota bacterium]
VSLLKNSGEEDVRRGPPKGKVGCRGMALNRRKHRRYDGSQYVQSSWSDLPFFESPVDRGLLGISQHVFAPIA